MSAPRPARQSSRSLFSLLCVCLSVPMLSHSELTRGRPARLCFRSTSYQVLNDEGIALRGLFIIDKEGILQHATINNLGFGRSVDETLRVLQALQYVQTHPDEVRSAHQRKASA